MVSRLGLARRTENPIPSRSPLGDGLSWRPRSQSRGKRVSAPWRRIGNYFKLKIISAQAIFRCLKGRNLKLKVIFAARIRRRKLTMLQGRHALVTGGGRGIGRA